MRCHAATLAIVLALGLGGTVAHAQSELRIGVLTDLSSVFTDLSGRGTITAAEMAVEDFGGKVGDRPIKVLSADMLNKADVGAAIARQWIDVDRVDVVADVPNSAVGLAVNEIVKDRNKVFIASGNISARFTGDACTANTVHWTIDTYAIARSTGEAVLKAGGDTWFFVTQDFASGHDMEKQTTAVVNANGGKVLGAVRHPLNTGDFSSFLLQAQASKAKIIALLNGGTDFINAVKQAEEFGIVAGGQKVVGMFAYVTEIHALGPKAAQGTLLTNAFYWDLNDQTRGFAKRFAERRGGRMPNQFQAGMYSAITHYLKSVTAAGGSDDGKAVVAKMKELPTDDPIFGKGQVRIDGRKIHPIYLWQVKTPQESTGPWDLYKQVGTTPAERAWRPLEEGGCPLVAGK
jgi:branched-chain amino acid transport system substrate-binding protein